MLRVEVDMFSGRPNPTWILTDATQTEEILGAVRESRGALAKPRTGFGGLGYREVLVSALGDDQRARGVPREFAIGSTAAEDVRLSVDLARRVIETMPLRSDVRLVEHATTPLTARLRETILEELERFLRDLPKWWPPPPPPPPNPLRTTVHDVRCENCAYEVSQFNPAFWNTASVQPHNNCYNYARNWRTNTFAQPGRAHGAQTGTMSCNAVTTAAMADGLVKRCTCLPDSEYPRRLMALVIWPNVDYHWYREQRGNFWGHKPGSTAARSYDNNGALVVNPETAARGGYINFCGYFYAGRSVVIN
ncbi:MAG TPA: hypothetical protein VGP92_16060 [Acidimicrobiia bacterium]|nr:hypothetical protein [Acidimicrobiia bacterium]